MPESSTATETEPVGTRSRYTTRTIMTAAAIGAAVGVILIPLNFAVMAVTTTLPILAVVTYGIWGMSALVPLGLLRKPGAGIIGATAAGLVSSVSPYGLFMVVMMVLWGVFMEASFFITRYRYFGWKSFAVVGILTGLLSSVMSIYSLNLLSMDLGLVIAICVVQVLSFIGCSLLSLALAKALQRAGIAGVRRRPAGE